MANDLQSQIDALRAELKQTDDWATGIFLALEKILPPLLRGHPELAKIEQGLKDAAQRFDTLNANPVCAENGETAEQYEVAKLLHQAMARLGVWTDKAG